jgi:hypothetical protein
MVSAMPYTVNGPYWMPENDVTIKVSANIEQLIKYIKVSADI